MLLQITTVVELSASVQDFPLSGVFWRFSSSEMWCCVDGEEKHTHTHTNRTSYPIIPELLTHFTCSILFTLAVTNYFSFFFFKCVPTMWKNVRKKSSGLHSELWFVLLHTDVVLVHTAVVYYIQMCYCTQLSVVHVELLWEYNEVTSRNMNMIYMHTYIHIYIHNTNIIYTNIHTYVLTYIHTYTHTHTYIHTYTHTHIHTYIQTYLRTYIYTYIHTYTHTYTEWDLASQTTHCVSTGRLN